MTEKTVVVTLWDADAANVLVKGNQFLKTNITNVDRNKSGFPSLFGGFPSFFPAFFHKDFFYGRQCLDHLN